MQTQDGIDVFLEKMYKKQSCVYTCGAIPYCTVHIIYLVWIDIVSNGGVVEMYIDSYGSLLVFQWWNTEEFWPNPINLYIWYYFEIIFTTYIP